MLMPSDPGISLGCLVTANYKVKNQNLVRIVFCNYKICKTTSTSARGQIKRNVFT